MKYSPGTISQETADNIIHSAIQNYWQQEACNNLDRSTTKHAFLSMWHAAMTGGSDFAYDFCTEFGEFYYEYSGSYTYGDHPDYGGGAECTDIETCTFEPNNVKRADLARVLGSDVLDMIDDFGLKEHDYFTGQ